MKSEKKLALVLSGGGIRAMLFHLGVLKYLAEQKSLESIARISTVSGGSLLIGLMLKESGMRWPTSSEFLDSVLPALRSDLCARSLQWGALRQLRPWQPQYLLSRANLLARALQREWGVTERLSELPEYPEWSINGTTAESGRRFRFKRDSVGDYSLGYASPGAYPLASALAVSAAFPGGFGPLALDTSQFVWMKRDWDAPPESVRKVDIGHPMLHLYDGGVYDNLGLEPFFDAGKCAPKSDGLRIVLSDAGAPLPTEFGQRALNPWRLKRVADIMSEQSRALRVRSFMHYLGKDRGRGAYIYIGMPAGNSGQVNGEHPAAFPTTLRRVNLTEFDGLANHGFAVASSELSRQSWLPSPHGGTSSVSAVA